MRCRGWLGVFLLAAWSQGAHAQATADDSLNDTQKLGRRLFGNHCVVCPPSALARQIGWVEEGRISGSS